MTKHLPAMFNTVKHTESKLTDLQQNYRWKNKVEGYMAFEPVDQANTGKQKNVSIFT
jgi:hypothetical protein